MTEKCDVYALGILLWETLTGLVPFAGFVPFQIMNRVCTMMKRPAIPVSCPGPVTMLIEKCWATDPHARLSCLDVRLLAPRLLYVNCIVIIAL